MFVGGGFFVVGALVGAFVGAVGDVEGGDDVGVVAGDEVADFEFAVDDDGEGGGLDAPDGGDVAGAGAAAVHAFGEGAGAVHADEPVGFAAAAGGVFEAGHAGAGA